MMPPSRRLHEVLRGLHAEILVVAAELLDAGVEDDEVVDQLQQARLVAELEQVPVEQVGSHWAAVFLPGQVILLRRLDGAVAQPLGVVARHHQLHGGEEGLDEVLLLVVQILADALGHRHGGALQLQHAERDAVDVEHHVRALACWPWRRRALTVTSSAMAKWLFSGCFQSISQTVTVFSPTSGLHLHAVAQQVVDRLVAVVEALAGVASPPCSVRAAPG